MQRRIEGFIWLDWVLDKLAARHNIEPEEVEGTFFNPPYSEVVYGKRAALC